MITPILILVVALALIFDFINGFHDAANSIATIVVTKVLTPFQAVLWATAFNFLAYFVITDHRIANTIAKTVNSTYVSMEVILSGLLAAITWNLITWRFGVPSSSSHTLIGGFVGAGMTNAVLSDASALSAINSRYVLIILACIVLAPVIGLAVSYCLARFIHYASRNINAAKLSRWSKTGQLISSAALSFAHGGNDAQKVMGIIYVSLLTSKVIDDGAKIPDWIALSCYTVIAMGTMFGGWKIIKTMGMKITRITPLKGVSAEMAGAVTLFITERLGIPVSTTHTLTGSIIGVGLTRGVSAVQWGTVKNLIWAWIITIPISAAFAAIVYSLIHYFSIRLS